MRILSVFGTRPEAIKMAPVLNALNSEAAIESLVCVTGQHREMLDQVLNVFGIVPDFDLRLMRANQSLNEFVSVAIGALDQAFSQAAPDYVLVHGDTSTALAAGLAAFHRNLPVAHVEAGLRTYDLARPWPEEMNRRIIDQFADVLFAPTIGSKENLILEGVQGRILVTGNTVIDALQMTIARLEQDESLRAAVDATLPRLNPGKKVVLVTGHRRENFGDGLVNICNAVRRIAGRKDVQVVYPVHLNPNVHEPVLRMLGGIANVHLVEPQQYLAFVRLLQRADVVLTDSGGVQEEAPALGKPVLVTREVTERPEAVATGAVRLVGADPMRIEEEVAAALARGRAEERESRVLSPYGDGRAAERIVNALLGRKVSEFASGRRRAAESIAA